MLWFAKMKCRPIVAVNLKLSRVASHSARRLGLGRLSQEPFVAFDTC